MISVFQTPIVTPKALRPCMARAHRGTNLALFAVALPVIIGFMAVGIYTGVTAYVQDALHNLTQNAALAGASARFVPNNNTSLNLTEANMVANMVSVCQEVGERQINNNPFLQSLGATVSCQPTTFGGGGGGQNGLQVNAVGILETPLLSLVSVGDITFTASSAAMHRVQLVDKGTPLESQNQAPAFAGCPASTPTGAVQEYDEWVMPITDRPGYDLLIGANTYRGYIVEGCTDDACWDIGGAARNVSTLANYQQVATLSDGRQRTIVYGSVMIDLGATGANGYDGQVRKMNRVRIYDDGLPVAFQTNGQAVWETACPNGTLEIGPVISLHHSEATVPTDSTLGIAKVNNAPFPYANSTRTVPEPTNP